MKRFLPLICALICFLIGPALADPLPLNQLPMYGGREKTEEMKKADARFLDTIQKLGLSREEGAKKAIESGWEFFEKKDLDSAMKRFNQAWLLDPENGNLYHGFALITSLRGGSPSEVENLFQLAMSKPKVDAEALVDYGRFLSRKKQYEKSLMQLNKALERSSTARNARSNISMVYYLKGDFRNACEWAKAAQKNGDALEAGFLDDVCRRAEK
jgi:Tfp pilus assembly protein PilF